ncbi:fibronectin type III [Paractinoplanes deccanensis]|uniref:Fibronectin type III n=1 Tax=Paractinoplanes deccanensis TaxID=113561 RepID=A0ABQ3Y6T9_9ACTN|nr:fibronectin type III domain-containing protein [Actinoplanes deccanensis]GID75697.1 fibronectin type III [Actinoplanes deccanensis]
MTALLSVAGIVTNPAPASAAPSAPDSATAVAGRRSILVSWVMPANPGTVAGYRATTSPGNFTCDVTSPSQTSCTIGGLTALTSYTVNVIACTTTPPNVGDCSAPATSNSAVPGPPGAPTSVGAVYQDNPNKMRVSWTPGTAGPGIASYKVTPYPLTDGLTGTCTTLVTHPTTTCDFENLVSDTSYTFRVQANGVTNEAGSTGTSLVSAASPAKVAGPPHKPAKPTTAYLDDTSVTVSWDKPAGGQPITGYSVVGSPSGSCSSVDPDVTTCDVTGLTGSTSYTFTVAATGDAGGTSGPSDPSDAVIPAFPGKPEPPAVELGDQAGEALVYWEPPADGGTVTQYIVRSYSPDDQTWGEGCTVSAPTTECVISTLENAKSYQFDVTAKNAAGEQTSGLSSPPIVSELPGKPSTPVVTLGDAPGEVSLTWQPPASGGTITSYGVTAIPATGFVAGVKSGDCAANLSAPACEITGLDPTVSYTFQVAAAGDLGATASDPSDPIIPDEPGVPRTVAAAIGDAEGTATVTWLAPNTGGEVVTYDVTAASDQGAESFGCADVDAGVTECAVTGLDPATAYTFTVTATNTAGTSAGVAAEPLVPSAPGKPTTPEVTLGDAPGKVNLTWDAPVSGGAVNGYTVNVIPATGADVGVLDASCATDLDNPACLITDLDPAVSYTFTVSAEGDLDTVTSDPSAAIVPDVVGVPADVTAKLVAATPGQIRVTWAAPTSGGTVDTYTVRALPLDGATAPSNAPCEVAGDAVTLACTLEDLDLAGEYQFTVEAENLLGPGSASVATAALMPDEPGAPQTVAAGLVENTPAAVDVTWSAPITGGAPTSYVVTSASTESGPETFGCPDLTANDLTCRITGLDTAKHYTFTVAAANAVGDTAAAPTAAIVADAPGEPTSVAADLDAIAGAGNALVTWVEPTGDAEIDGYTVTATSPDGGVTPSDCTALAGETECLVAGLEEDKQYAFTVAAGNLAGETASAATDPIVPGAPLAPTDVQAGVTTTPGTVVVSWTQPPGVVVDTWTVTPESSDGGTEPSPCVVTPPQALQCTFAGLSQDKHYTFAITSENVLGPGLGYTTDPPVIPNRPATPGAPQAEITSVDENAGTGTVTVTWRAAPESAGPITGYTITAYAESDPGVRLLQQSCVEVLADGPLTCDFTVSSLEDTYTFTVSSIGAGGSAAESAPSEPVDMRAPGLPGTPTVTLGGANAVRVTWDAPVEGGPIVGYDVRSSPIVVTPQNCTNVGAKSRTCIFTGLTSGNRYSFNVRANGTGGRYVETDFSETILVGAPDVPERPVVAPGDATDTVRVSWTRPAAGAGIAGYTVQLENGSEACTALSDQTSCAATGLTAASSYRFRVQANGVVDAGDSAFSPFSEAIVPGAPGRPQNVDVVGGDRQIAVSWSAPQYGADRVVSYRAVATPGGGSCTTASAAVRECVITASVENLASYRVTVVAVGAGLESPASVPSARVRPTAGPPGAPAGVQASGLNAGARVSWTAPAATGDGVAGYTATATNTAGSSRSCSTTELTCTISGLTNAQTYRVTVVALGRGASGYSPPSAAVTVVPSVPPSAPTNASLVVGARAFTVSWTASAGQGDGLTGYTATASGGGTSLTCTTTTTSCTISGLTAGTSYTVSVVANGTQQGTVSTAATVAGEHVALTATAPTLPSTLPISAGTLTSSAASPLRLGQQVTISGTGYAPYTGVTVGIYPGPGRLGATVTNADGSFSLPVTIGNVTAGTSRTITAGGMFTAGTVRYKTLSVTVNP